VYSGSDSDISSGFPEISQAFPLVGFPSIREKEKGLKPSLHCLHAMSISPSTDFNLKIPTMNMCENEFLTWGPNFTMIQRLTSPGS